MPAGRAARPGPDALGPALGPRFLAGPGGLAGGHLVYPKLLEMTPLKYDPLQNITFIHL